MAGIYDGQQAASNAETTEAIRTGQAHVYYGLVAGMGLCLYGLAVGGNLWWVFVALLVLLVGIAVDLYAHNFTH